MFFLALVHAVNWDIMSVELGSQKNSICFLASSQLPARVSAACALAHSPANNTATVV